MTDCKHTESASAPGVHHSDCQQGCASSLVSVICHTSDLVVMSPQHYNYDVNTQTAAVSINAQEPCSKNRNAFVVFYKSAVVPT